MRHYKAEYLFSLANNSCILNRNIFPDFYPQSHRTTSMSQPVIADMGYRNHQVHSQDPGAH